MSVYIAGIDGKLKKVAGNSGSSLPVGTIFPSAIPLTDARVRLLDGSTISQTGVYSDFANLIKTLVSSGYNISCSQTEFDADVTATGNCGKFVIDNTSGTIRLPKITTFIQGLSSITNIGSSLSAGLPNITGQVGGMGNRFFVNENSGAFSNNTDKANSANTIGPTGQSYSAQTYYGAKFDANAGADVKGIYGNSNTVQPRATQFPYYIVLANGYKSSEAVNIDNVITEVNNKLERTLQLVAETTLTASGNVINVNIPNYDFDAIYEVYVNTGCTGYSADIHLTINNDQSNIYSSTIMYLTAKNTTLDTSSLPVGIVYGRSFADNICKITLMRTFANSIVVSATGSFYEYNGTYESSSANGAIKYTGSINSIQIHCGNTLVAGSRIKVYKK